MERPNREGPFGRGAPSPLAVLLLAASAVGCIDRFDTPSLYDDESYSCERPSSDAFNEQLEACWSRDQDTCADDPAGASNYDCSCAGLLSLDGEVDGRAFRFASELNAALLRLIPQDPAAPGSAADGGVDEVPRRLALYGKGPYFDYGIRLNNLPGLWHDRPIETTRRFPLPFEDPRTGRELNVQVTRLEAQGDAVIPDLSQASGWVEFRLESADEYRGSFSAAAGGDRLAGCFATRISIIR